MFTIASDAAWETDRNEDGSRRRAKRRRKWEEEEEEEEGSKGKGGGGAPSEKKTNRRRASKKPVWTVPPPPLQAKPCPDDPRLFPQAFPSLILGSVNSIPKVRQLFSPMILCG